MLLSATIQQIKLIRVVWTSISHRHLIQTAALVHPLAGGVDFTLGAYGPNPFYNISPADLEVYSDDSDYYFGHRFDGSLGTPAPFAQRVQDAKWLISAKEQLQQFNPPKGSSCAKDISALDLDPGKIRSLAGDTRSKGGTDLVDIRAIVNPATRALFNRNADATADVEAHAIVFNMANFWQTSYSEIMGTMLHELIHMAHWGYADTEIQRRLGLVKNADDTTNISTKLASDCFQGVKPPLPQRREGR